MSWPFRSTPARLSWFVPVCSGILTTQLVNVVQVSGYAAPLIQTVAIFTGAVPDTYARLLLTSTLAFTEKFVALTTASCAPMLLWACDSQGSMFAPGFSTFRPLAMKALYLASIKGPLLATFSGPLTSSCNARQYMRRKVGLLKMAGMSGSCAFRANRCCPGPQDPLSPNTRLKSHI